MRCSNCPGNSQCAVSRGPKDSPFVIIGESPSGVDLHKGRAFMGPNSAMLQDALKRASLPEDIQPLFMNAINCYIPGKDKDKVKRAVSACRQRLLAEIRAHPRKVILALGNGAAWAVTGDENIAITRRRGDVIKSELASEGIVLAVHPAYLMRNGSGYSTWIKDLIKATKLLRGISLSGWSDPTFEVIDTLAKYKQIPEEYHLEPVITADTETDALHYMDGRMLCLALVGGKGDHAKIISEDMLYGHQDITKRLMEQGNWSWHNATFDLKWFRRMGIKATATHDTMLASYTLNENGGYHDLDQVAYTWIGAENHKGMIDKHLPKKGASYRYIPLDILYDYAAKDTSKTHIMRPHLLDEINANEHCKKLYYNLLIPAVEFIVNMQMYGVEVDTDRVKLNIVEHEKQLLDLRAKMNVYANKHLGHDINPNSPKQLQELLYTKMGLGKPTDSTSEGQLIEVQRKHNHPIIDILLDHREVAKRKGTYVANLLPDETRKKNPAGFIKQDGRIHADFKLHGTATGRLAGAEPNLLNQPRGPLIRSQYKAAPKKIFCEVDLNQAELRSLALMSGDKVLMDIYTKNEVSIHDVTTGQFYAPKADVLSDPEVAAKVAKQLFIFHPMPPAQIYSEAKMRGKAVNFGIVYGREAFSLAKEFNIPLMEAVRWIEAWMSTYEGAAAFIKWCRERPALGKDIITVFGRQKRHGVVSRDNLKALQNEASNFPHQSTASDIMLKTAIEVQPVLANKWNAHIWNELYDAIYFECEDNDELLTEAITYIQGVITRIPKDHGLHAIDFLGDAKVGYNWGHMYDWKGSVKESLPQFN